MNRSFWKILAIALAVVAIACLVSSPAPLAQAETLEDVVPKYEPVILAAQDVKPLSYDEATPYAPHKNAFFADKTGYLDDTISVQVDSFRWFNTNIQVTWVQIADASQLRAASYKKFPSSATAYADKIAQREKAVLAMNGDFIVKLKFGYSVRNGKQLRRSLKSKEAQLYDGLMIDDKGDFTIIQQMDDKKIDAYNAEHNIVHAYTFGPALVIDGVRNDYYPVKTQVADHRTQRVALGQMDELSYVIVNTEGPDDRDSTGITIGEMAQIMMALGAKNAYNMDGGSSSWLVLNYERINARNGSKHRDVADIIYFATACPE